MAVENVDIVSPSLVRNLSSETRLETRGTSKLRDGNSDASKLLCPIAPIIQAADMHIGHGTKLMRKLDNQLLCPSGGQTEYDVHQPESFLRSSVIAASVGTATRGV